MRVCAAVGESFTVSDLGGSFSVAALKEALEFAQRKEVLDREAALIRAVLLDDDHVLDDVALVTAVAGLDMPDLSVDYMLL